VSPPVSPTAAAPVKFQPAVLTVGVPTNSAKTSDCENILGEKKRRENNRMNVLYIKIILIKNRNN
jgi:hypothetical protein